MWTIVISAAEEGKAKEGVNQHYPDFTTTAVASRPQDKHEEDNGIEPCLLWRVVPYHGCLQLRCTGGSDGTMAKKVPCHNRKS